MTTWFPVDGTRISTSRIEVVVGTERGWSLPKRAFVRRLNECSVRGVGAEGGLPEASVIIAQLPSTVILAVTPSGKRYWSEAGGLATRARIEVSSTVIGMLALARCGDGTGERGPGRCRQGGDPRRASRSVVRPERLRGGRRWSIRA